MFNIKDFIGIYLLSCFLVLHNIWLRGFTIKIKATNTIEKNGQTCFCLPSLNGDDDEGADDKDDGDGDDDGDNHGDVTNENC